MFVSFTDLFHLLYMGSLPFEKKQNKTKKNLPVQILYTEMGGPLKGTYRVM